MAEPKKRGILSLFVQDTESEKEPEQKTQPSATSTMGDFRATKSAAPNSLSGTGTINEDIKKQLLDTVSEANISGYDYLEFRDSLNNMIGVIPSEPDRFKAAYAAVKTMVTVDRLIQTADVYIGVLQKKKGEFEQFVSSALAQKVTGKENEAKKLDQDIASKQEQITKLNQDISQVQEKRATLLNESVIERAKIERVKMDFDLTYQSVVGAIESDQQKIKTYLSKEGK
jgi:hypothetical protein